MKIIRSGHKEKPWVGKKFTCDECGCVFVLEEKDRPKRYSDQRDGDYYEIKCPECKETMAIDAGIVERNGI